MTTKHTPGPWIDKDKKGKYLAEKTKWTADYEGKMKDGVATSFPIMAGKEVIALMVGTGFDADEKLKANSNLIIAAPDMLEALECVEALEFKYQDGLQVLLKCGFDPDSGCPAAKFIDEKVTMAIRKAKRGG